MVIFLMPHWLLTLFLLASLASPAQALVFSAQADTTTLQTGETLRLTLRIDESNKGEDPDLSPLEKDFRILGTQFGSSTRLTQRGINTETNWIVTLMPKRKGTLTIPAINFDGVLSKPITVTVNETTKPGNTARDANQLVFLDAQVDAKEVYVQQQVNFTLRLYKRTELHDASLVQPEVEGAVQEKLGSQRSYNAVIDGRDYEVVENRFAYFPQKSGTFVIPPAELNATIAVGGNSFLDPFLGTMGKQIRRVSNGIEIKVLAKPDSFPANAAWLPTTQLRINETIAPNKSEFNVGEPITRIITLEAQGVAPSLLPPLPVSQGDGYKVYPEPADTKSLPDANGVSSRRVETQAYIPTQPGPLRLPAIEIPFWNVQENRLDKAVLPERIFTITGTAAISAADALPKTEQTQDVPPQSIALADNAATQQWQWLALGTSGLWLVTVLLWAWQWRRQRQGIATPASNTPENTTVSSRRDALFQACKQQNPVAAKKALISWFKALDEQSNVHCLGHVSQQAISALLAKATRELEETLYRPAESILWQSEGLRKGIADEESQRRIKKRQPSRQLSPLHP